MSDLPPEVLRRILHHALALPPSSPLPLTADRSPDTSWDEMAGRSARRVAARRVALREAVARDARVLLTVCKAWKPLVMKYLYAEPNVHADNVVLFAEAVAAGDRKWSDLNIHPFSHPGRWITSLDLSHLGPGGSYLGADAATAQPACTAILSLTPSVTHLRLPAGEWAIDLDDLRSAPCTSNLRVVEGVRIGEANRRGQDERSAIRAIRAMPNLQVLGIVWAKPREEDVDWQDEFTRSPEPKPFEFPKLHTLTLVSATPGLLVGTLTRSHLPSLNRLVLSLYHDTWPETNDEDPYRGGTHAFQYAHGVKIRSLTYAATPHWPRRDHVPPTDTLQLHPNLEHIHLALPNSVLHEHPEFAHALAEQGHPLAAVTIPRWPRVSQASPSPGPPPAAAAPGVTPSAPDSASRRGPGGNRFLSALFERHSSIRTITVDGFTWVTPALGRFAAESGDSGMMRAWAAWLARNDVQLKDMDGAAAPVLERGRRGGRRSIDSGR